MAGANADVSADGQGRKQLSIEQSRWDELVRAMARVLKPV